MILKSFHYSYSSQFHDDFYVLIKSPSRGVVEFVEIVVRKFAG